MRIRYPKHEDSCFRPRTGLQPPPGGRPSPEAILRSDLSLIVRHFPMSHRRKEIIGGNSDNGKVTSEALDNTEHDRWQQ